MRSFYLILFFLPAFCFVNFSFSQESKLSELQVEKLTQEFSESTMSPYCPGRTISACPSIQARELREQIYTWFSSGYSKKAVLNQLLAIYGDEVRGVPDSNGFGKMAWLIPVFFVLLGISLLCFYLNKSINTAKVTAERVKTLDESMLKKINSELLEKKSS